MFIYRWAHKLETDPAAQFKFHRNLTVFWIVTMILIPLTPPFLFLVHTSDQWGSHTVVDFQKLAALLIMEVSLWANAFTHFGALSGALAAMHTDPTNETLLEHIDQPAALADLDRQAADTQEFLDEKSELGASWLDQELLNDPADYSEPEIELDVPHNLNP